MKKFTYVTYDVPALPIKKIRKFGPAKTVLSPPEKTFRSGPPYLCPELDVASPRLGAMAAFECPSRIGSRLYYRDGRVEDMSNTRREP